MDLPPFDSRQRSFDPQFWYQIPLSNQRLDRFDDFTELLLGLNDSIEPDGLLVNLDSDRTGLKLDSFPNRFADVVFQFIIIRRRCDIQSDDRKDDDSHGDDNPMLCFHETDYSKVHRVAIE